MSRVGVLLDRDGTIIEDTGYVGSVERVRFIEGAAEAVAAFNRAGIAVAVLTNQAGVARGLYGIDGVEAVHRHITERLAAVDAHVDLFLYCPYHPEGTVEGYARRSFDRKPEPGMAFAAARELELDLGSSWVIGDSDADMGMAAACGALGVYIGPDPDDHDAMWSFPDLASAAPFILHRSGADLVDDPRAALHTLPAAGRPKFPKVSLPDAAAYGAAYLAESRGAARSIDLRELDRAARLLTEAYRGDAAVFTFGNGGSAAIANHLCCDHLKGIRTGTDLSPRVVSLSNNVELLTAIANDLSYDEVFSYQLQSQGRPGDVVVAISASGQSPNVVGAIRWARDNGLHTIALTGFGGGEARRLADVSLHVESANYGVVEDNHQAIMHVLSQHIRQSAMAPDAVAVTSF